jgi:hypothetical protein
VPEIGGLQAARAAAPPVATKVRLFNIGLSFVLDENGAIRRVSIRQNEEEMSVALVRNAG